LLGYNDLIALDIATQDRNRAATSRMSGLVAYGSSDEEDEVEVPQVSAKEVKVCSIASPITMVASY
jgi:hypothetical protein